MVCENERYNFSTNPAKSRVIFTTKGIRCSFKHIHNVQKYVPLYVMETQRQERISRLIQKDIGEILQQSGRDWFPGAMITVTKVYVTADLSIARVYLSIFGKDAQKVLQQVELKGKEIRKQLGYRVKNQLRQVPELRFFVDDSLDYIDKIDKLLND